jgi:hypothetical protein
VAAKRPSKDAGRGARAVVLRGSLRLHLGMTDDSGRADELIE